MGLFNLFRTDTESTELVAKRNEVATIKVPEIKEYLVQEYERSQQLYQANERLREELRLSEETKEEYKATLVTLAEYKDRLDRQEAVIKQREQEVEDAKTQMRAIRDELNDYKIRFSRASLTKERIREEVVEEVKSGILKAILRVKGNLSKTRITEIVRDWKPVPEEEPVKRDA